VEGKNLSKDIKGVDDLLPVKIWDVMIDAVKKHSRI
jgi:hypothetical protein